MHTGLQGKCCWGHSHCAQAAAQLPTTVVSIKSAAFFHKSRTSSQGTSSFFIQQTTLSHSTKTFDSNLILPQTALTILLSSNCAIANIVMAFAAATSSLLAYGKPKGGNSNGSGGGTRDTGKTLQFPLHVNFLCLETSPASTLLR